MNWTEYCKRKIANKPSKLLFQVGKILIFIKIRLQQEYKRMGPDDGCERHPKYIDQGRRTRKKR